MAWLIRLSRRAVEQVRAMEPSLRDELIGRMGALSESPSEFLRRTSASREFAGLYLSAYRSEVIPGLIINVYFEGFDGDPPRLTMVAIVQYSEGADTED